MISLGWLPNRRGSTRLRFGNATRVWNHPMNKNEIKAATNQALLGEEWGYEMRRHDVAAGSPDIVFCIVPADDWWRRHALLVIHGAVP